MSKKVNTLIWTITSLVLLIFSEWLIKSENAATIVNIIACLIFVQVFMNLFGNGSKREAIYGYIGIAAFLVSIIIDLLKLSFM